MNLEFIVAILSGLLSVIAGGIFTTDIVRKLVYKLFGKQLPSKTYAERLSNLTDSLTKASSEVDSILHEMNRVSRERETSIRELEAGLTALEKREKELKEKISVLQSVPIPVAEHFAKLVESSERRNARRDYLLFIAGVIVTTIVAVVLRMAFGI